ncbi:MAG: DUF1501 domain-containing protein [Planctomycetes bacterium]|nr:DUF1501 domain-containing protein [Planctomycetota bacterium]
MREDGAVSEPGLIRGITRRDALRRIAIVAAGVPMAATLGRVAWAGDAPTTPPTAKTARAKAVIEIWMAGGPCHIDTFDPKPEAGEDYAGPLGAPIQTNADGIRIGSLLPLLAKQADKYSIIRSMSHGNNGHETAAYITQTGRNPGERLVYPGFGAVVSLFKGGTNAYTGVIPPYVVLTAPLGRFSESGFLGPKYAPFATGGDPNQRRFAVEGIVAEGISDERQKDRRELLHKLDALGHALPKSPGLEALDRCEDKAYDMILGDAGRVFDLSEEKDPVRDSYGRTTFGQSCLVARRLVETGVPYVTIHVGGWDTHKQHFETMRRRLPDLDRGVSTLLQDLAGRGLLDSTIVWCGGEFGRTPKVLWEAPWNGGRGHHGRCFSTLVAGGGFKGGVVVGTTDKKGEDVADRPVHPRELHGAMYEKLGIDPDGPLPNQRGLDVTVTDPLEGGADAKRLPEIA